VKLLDQLIGRQIRKPLGLSGWVLGHLMANEHKHLVNWMLESLNIQSTDYVLDVGCGGGMALKTIAGTASNGFTAGIDYSLAMTKQAARRNSTTIKRGNMSILQGDAMALPFNDGCFNTVCGVETFYFWPEPLSGLKEIWRVLRPGGSVALVMDISKETSDASVTVDIGERLGFQVYSGKEMEALLSEAGFSDVTFKAIPERGKGWLCASGAKPAPDIVGK
jgi:SAM-dependent methyltransferase